MAKRNRVAEAGYYRRIKKRPERLLQNLWMIWPIILRWSSCSGERHMISGYLTGDQYTLELCNIDTDSMLFTMTSASRDECVSAFEKARVFDGQTISEAEHEIEVLYG